jgi:hypothetical protein
MMLSDTGRILDSANRADFNAMGESLGVYFNVLNLFVRMVELLDKK